MLAASAAALGYVGKLIMEYWSSVREARNARRAQLVELNSLLGAAWVSFSIQVKHAKRLVELLRERNPELEGADDGSERIFSRAYSSFTQEERDLHAIIRGITVHSLRPTNEAMSNWLKNDTYFKAQEVSKGVLGDLARKLSLLEAHLTLWHAKFEIWIPETPEHALVFMADEESHGMGFPRGIDDLVRKALQWER